MYFPTKFHNTSLLHHTTTGKMSCVPISEDDLNRLMRDNATLPNAVVVSGTGTTSFLSQLPGARDTVLLVALILATRLAHINLGELFGENKDPYNAEVKNTRFSKTSDDKIATMAFDVVPKKGQDPMGFTGLTICVYFTNAMALLGEVHYQCIWRNAN